MKKSFKRIVLATTLLLLTSSSFPTITVLAEAQGTHHHTAVNDRKPRQMSELEKDQLVEEVKRNHPTVSKSFIRKALEKQLVGDYSIPIESNALSRSPWQGITVDQMGALIDTGLGALLGVGAGGIAGAIKTVGKRAAKESLRQVITRYGLSILISDQVLDFALNLFSPGHHIATYWDQHDKVPNNGRINFEW
ncbi:MULTISPECIES: hypothetical protein [Streptococcus]|uniref:Uncharacterized protein n=1 Tax=Streptococcus suis TaxID=1307 RepID=A0A3Q8B931_STRSU|nr:hypothetical protein [Streptococcus suis]ASW50447.1 hypothetical protein A7J08_09250 [Streptococcus suis]KPA72534.1 hypothetical protein WQ51_02805 [Streptococcus suis]MBM0194556.1 hypothetical protein [Streptococcus suis]MBM7317024.1 hypothetical protein [Streptococcus suis]MBM7320864.1 hypothetical protein [Streptococcus suis]